MRAESTGRSTAMVQHFAQAGRSLKLAPGRLTDKGTKLGALQLFAGAFRKRLELGIWGFVPNWSPCK